MSRPKLRKPLWWLSVVIAGCYGYYYFNTCDAGFGAAIVSGLAIWGFIVWRAKIEQSEALEFYRECLRSNQRRS